MMIKLVKSLEENEIGVDLSGNYFLGRYKHKYNGEVTVRVLNFTDDDEDFITFDMLLNTGKGITLGVNSSELTDMVINPRKHLLSYDQSMSTGGKAVYHFVIPKGHDAYYGEGFRFETYGKVEC